MSDILIEKESIILYSLDDLDYGNAFVYHKGFKKYYMRIFENLELSMKPIDIETFSDTGIFLKEDLDYFKLIVSKY